VRNIMIHGEYQPRAVPRGPALDPGQLLARGGMTADELLRHYVTHVYMLTGSYQETARRLKIDRRTARSKVDPALLEQLRARA